MLFECPYIGHQLRKGLVERGGVGLVGADGTHKS